MVPKTSSMCCKAFPIHIWAAAHPALTATNFSFILFFSFTACGLNSRFCALLSSWCVFFVFFCPLLSLSAESPPAQTDSHSEADEWATAGWKQGSDPGRSQTFSACQALRIRGAVAAFSPAHLASLFHSSRQVSAPLAGLFPLPSLLEGIWWSLWLKSSMWQRIFWKPKAWCYCPAEGRILLEALFSPVDLLCLADDADLAVLLTDGIRGLPCPCGVHHLGEK